MPTHIPCIQPAGCTQPDDCAALHICDRVLARSWQRERPYHPTWPPTYAQTVADPLLRRLLATITRRQVPTFRRVFTPPRTRASPECSPPLGRQAEPGTRYRLAADVGPDRKRLAANDKDDDE